MASKKVKLSCRNVWKVYGKNPDGFFNNRSGNISDPKKLSKDMHEKQHIVNMKPPALSDEELSGIVKQLNDSAGNNDKVSFSFHEKTNRIIIRIKNENDEIVREIPSEDSIKLLEHIQEHMGLLIDESR